MAIEHKLTPVADAAKNPPVHPLQHTVTRLQEQLRMAQMKERAVDQMLGEQINHCINSKTALNIMSEDMHRMKNQVIALTSENEKLKQATVGDVSIDLMSKIEELTEENARLTRVTIAFEKEVCFLRKARAIEPEEQDVSEGSEID